jgi:tetratricopeptide (TPR) repeat protein
MDKNTIARLLKNANQEELIKIINTLVSFDSDSEEWLLDYCKQKGDSSSKTLIAKKQILHYWNEAEEIIGEANEYGGTYNEDDAYNALSMIAELCNETKTDWKFRQPIVDEMLEQFYIGNSGFDDALVDSCMVLCQSKNEKLYLAAALSKGGDYYAGVAARMFLEYGIEDKYLNVRQDHLHYGSDYIELANYYVKKNQNDKAIELVEEALKSADGRMDEVYEWLFKKYVKKKQEDKIIGLYHKAIEKKWNVDVMVKLMYQYYKDDYTEKKKYLLKMMDVCETSIVSF